MTRSIPAIALVFSLVTSAASAQDADQGPPNLVTMTDQENATSLYEQHLVFLAHPALEGRLPGREGCDVAETMIATTFRQLGLLSPESLSNFRQSFQFNQRLFIPIFHYINSFWWWISNAHLKLLGAMRTWTWRS